MIEKAYHTGEKLGLSVWTQDEAGPYQPLPYPGASWPPLDHPALQPHEYIRNGTAKLLPLFHPATGQVRVKGVMSSANEGLHPWLKEELRAILQSLPQMSPLDAETNRRLWQTWQEGLSLPISLPQELPALRMRLIWDNLRGHYTPGDRPVVVCSGHYALVHSFGRLVVEYGRVDAAYSAQTGIGWPTSGNTRSNHLLVGRSGPGVEPEPHPV